jgi:sulfur-oxidizing protein SoxX
LRTRVAGIAVLLCAALRAGGAEPSGPALAQETGKGNCLACHSIPKDPSAYTMANIGPPLINMPARFPSRAGLRAQIWDARAANPDTVMPPYGAHGILTEPEIDRITDYIYAQ